EISAREHLDILDGDARILERFEHRFTAKFRHSLFGIAAEFEHSGTEHIYVSHFKPSWRPGVERGPSYKWFAAIGRTASVILTRSILTRTILKSDHLVTFAIFRDHGGGELDRHIEALLGVFLKVLRIHVDEVRTDTYSFRKVNDCGDVGSFDAREGLMNHREHIHLSLIREGNRL